MTYEFPHDPPADERTITHSASRSRRPSRRLLFLYSCAVAAFTIAVDVISKQLALLYLSTEERIDLLGEFLGLQLAFNTGAAFSIGSKLTPFITLLGLIATVLLIRAALRTKHRNYAAAIGLILGGALGNLVDRLFAPPGFGRGAVTDFLAYGQQFIGNLADVAIGAGVVLYALGAWRLHAVSCMRDADDSAECVEAELPTSYPVSTGAETRHL